jgi:density-regulated protein DRP1
LFDQLYAEQLAAK